MKLTRNITCFAVLLLSSFLKLNAQLYKIALDTKINKSTLIVEAKIVDQYSFWNDKHTVIYTSNKLHVYKLFKGKLISKEIEVLTLGGSIGNKCLVVSDVLQLNKEQTGMFFLQENAGNILSSSSKKILYDVYSSKQGFLQYDKQGKKAFAPFAKYDNIQQTLYNLIRQRTGTQEQIIDNSFETTSSASFGNGSVDNGTGDVAIVSFSPATVYAGAINNEANNVLTVSGSGFGNDPSNKAGVLFKDANSDNTDPDYKVSYNSPYIISWTDTEIKVRVPDRAGTGKFDVMVNDGTTAESVTDLQILFAVLDAEFDNGDIVREPRLMNTNNSGGYTVQYSTSIKGGGIDFTTSPAKQTFERALTTWKEITGANLTVGSPTELQQVADDSINLVVFDNDNTGHDKMADGVLESTFSWFSACSQGSTILTAQKTGFDIIIRNNDVSTGDNISFEMGPCFPAANSYDLEMIILHEIGHALNLAHINDDYENDGGGYPTINPSKLMHYAILDYVDRRSPDASAYLGALYTITPQLNTYGSCGLFDNEMSPLPVQAVTNDECPSTFPATELQNNTTVTFDLIHATSNKFKDPSYKQINCKNTGTSVTNNAYYAFLNGTKTTLTIDITGYTTVPADLKSCAEQSVRVSLYDVQNCPQGQSYPQPAACSNFSSNGTLSFSGLQQNHKYLLYFDGVRNTKAAFNAVFNSDSSNTIPTTPVVTAYPNPVVNTDLNIKIENTSGSYYEYALFDAVGKHLLTGKASVTLPTQVFNINMKAVAAGVYFLKIFDENGKTVVKKKILKQNK